MATLFYDERRVATGVLETVLERKPNRRTPGARKDPIRILYIVDQLTDDSISAGRALSVFTGHV